MLKKPPHRRVYGDGNKRGMLPAWPFNVGANLVFALNLNKEIAKLFLDSP